MIKPRFLNTGDPVAIVAPGGKVKPGDTEAAVAAMRDWGFKVRMGRNLFAATHGYLAGSDDERLADLQEALNDPEIRAVFCARGGYGTTRILDRLDFTAFCKDPKWVAGYSDITALHLALHHLGIASIHGTMPLLFARHGASPSVDSLRRTLLGEQVILKGKPNMANREGAATGPVVGGNLSLVADSLGTQYEPDTKGKIMVIEEIDEYDYRIDRMLTQLKRAGKLDGLAGLAVGYITRAVNPRSGFTESVEAIVLDKVKEFHFPVAFGAPIGHEEPNIAFCHGCEYKLTVAPGGSTLELA